VGHPYRAPLWMTASGSGDCSRTPLDDEIDDEEPVDEAEPEFYDDEIFEEEPCSDDLQTAQWAQ
jgi:hypothetical protein